jgi:hypothetical protein
MEAEHHLERLPCPACGGAGGGPFGRAGSAWDDEEYVCSRCEGVGFVVMDDVMLVAQRPGLVKAVPDAAPAKPDTNVGKRKASA